MCEVLVWCLAVMQEVFLLQIQGQYEKNLLFYLEFSLFLVCFQELAELDAGMILLTKWDMPKHSRTVTLHGYLLCSHTLSI